MTSDLKFYESYWTTDSADYWLVSSDQPTRNVLERCIIVQRSTAMLVGIENDQVAKEVITRMHAAGVPIVDWAAYKNLVASFKEQWAAEDIELERRFEEKERRRKNLE